MKGSKHFPLLGVVLVLCAVMGGCGGGAPKSGAPALVISSSMLSQGVVNVLYPTPSNPNVNLAATGGVVPYTWSIISGSLPPGLSMNSAGTISGIPCATCNSTYNFTVQVTDSQTPVKAVAKTGLSIIINPALAITTTLPQATVDLFYTGTLTATGGLPPVAWSIVPNSGNLPTGLSLSGSTISGTPASGSAGNYTFTVQAVDQASETQTAPLTLTVVGLLEGGFTFSFSGFNGDNHQPFYQVANFVGDGNGNITSGVLDQNGTDSVGPLTAATFTGTYSVTPQGKGTLGGLGTMTLNICTDPPGCSNMLTYQYGISVAIDGTVRVILSDPNHTKAWGSGLIATQNLAGLSSQFAGCYTYGFIGSDTSNQRYAGAGMFNLMLGGTGGCGGLQTGTGQEDNNDNGNVNNGGSLQTPLNTSIAIVTQPDSTTGRGTMTLTVNGAIRHYTYYVTDPITGMVAVQTDPASSTPVTLLSIFKQLPGTIGGSGGAKFSATNLNGGSVMELNAICPAATCNGGPLPDESLGVATFDGKGDLAGPSGAPGYYLDENQGGTTTSQSCIGGSYSVANNGRVTVKQTGCSGTPALTPPPVVWYLYNSNQGFVVGGDNEVTAGTFEPQSAGPFCDTSLVPNSLSNGASMVGGTVPPVQPSVTNELQSVVAFPSTGVWQITYTDNGPSGIVPSTNLNLGWRGRPDTVGTGNNACPGATGGNTYETLLGEFQMGFDTPPPANTPVVIQDAYLVTAYPSGSGNNQNEKLVILPLLQTPPAMPTQAPPAEMHPHMVFVEH